MSGQVQSTMTTVVTYINLGAGRQQKFNERFVAAKAGNRQWGRSSTLTEPKTNNITVLGLAAERSEVQITSKSKLQEAKRPTHLHATVDVSSGLKKELSRSCAWSAEMMLACKVANVFPWFLHLRQLWLTKISAILSCQFSYPSRSQPAWVCCKPVSGGKKTRVYLMHVHIHERK